MDEKRLREHLEKARERAREIWHELEGPAYPGRTHKIKVVLAPELLAELGECFAALEDQDHDA